MVIRLYLEGSDVLQDDVVDGLRQLLHLFTLRLSSLHLVYIIAGELLLLLGLLLLRGGR